MCESGGYEGFVGAEGHGSERQTVAITEQPRGNVDMQMSVEFR